MKFTDNSNITPEQKASLKTCPIVLEALHRANDKGLDVIITSRDAGYHKDLFVYIDTGLQVVTAYFQDNKLIEVK